MLPYAFAGLLALAATIALYFGAGGSRPVNLTEWAAFGSYVGGIAGPLLSFIALLAVARTLNLQRSSLQLEHNRNDADKQLRWLDATYRDIGEVLQSPVGSDLTLRQVLDQEVDDALAHDAKLRARLDELLKLTADYCQAVALYRENVSEFFDLRIYAVRGGRLLDSIKPFADRIGPTAFMTVEFCDMHLRGDEERASPEALSRRSRP